MTGVARRARTPVASLQARQDSSRIHAIEGIERFAYLLMDLFGRSLGHDVLGHETTLANQLPRINFRRTRDAESLLTFQLDVTDAHMRPQLVLSVAAIV
jgi:hypothetical protein